MSTAAQAYKLVLSVVYNTGHGKYNILFFWQRTSQAHIWKLMHPLIINQRDILTPSL